MKQLKLLFIFIKHGINPFCKSYKVKHKYYKLTDNDLVWIRDNFGDTMFEIWTKWKEESNETARNSRYRK